VVLVRSVTSALAALVVVLGVLGPASGAASAAPTRCPSFTDPVYRAVHPSSHAVMLTPGLTEFRRATRSGGYATGTGIAFSASATRVAGTVGVWRLRQPETGDLLYTTREREVVSATSRRGYVDEGIRFYASTSARGCLHRVQRYVKGSHHQYATSRTERLALSRSGWEREGVAFYAGAVRAATGASRATARSAATRILGPSRSGLPWHSGAWTGGRFDAAGANAFGTWRGRPSDIATTYVDPSSFASMSGNPWSIYTWEGFQGRLSYGLRLLPTDGSGSLASIARGDQDATWEGVAQNLVRYGRGDSIVRLAWESNLTGWRHAATAENASEWKRAYRRVATVMRRTAPDLVFEFGVACGSGLTGSGERLAPLTQVYPGDDVVDLVGCDTYDWWSTHADSSATWQEVLSPAAGPGIQDVVDFARAHGKGASFGEWGLAANTGGNNAGGDNPFYVRAMFAFFLRNQDVLAFEAYFDEPAAYIANSLQDPQQNPDAAAAYRSRW